MGNAKSDENRVRALIVEDSAGNHTIIPLVADSITQRLLVNATITGVVSATLIKKTVDFTASQTAQTIWDPTEGTKFVICDIILAASAAGTITVFDGTDDTTNRVLKAYFAANGGLCKNYRKPMISATADNILKYTTGSGITGSITVSGYEV